MARKSNRHPLHHWFWLAACGVGASGGGPLSASSIGGRSRGRAWPPRSPGRGSFGIWAGDVRSQLRIWRIWVLRRGLLQRNRFGGSLPGPAGFGQIVSARWARDPRSTRRKHQASSKHGPCAPTSVANSGRPPLRTPDPRCRASWRRPLKQTPQAHPDNFHIY